MDEIDEANLGAVSTSYELERERLNERPETLRPATTGKRSKIGCLWLFGLVWIISGLFWAITELLKFLF